MEKIAIMALSGGMDSTGLLIDLLAKDYSVHAISFDYGQKHIIEINRAKKNIEYLSKMGIDVEHKIVDLSDVMKIFYSALTSDELTVPEGYYEEEQMKATVVPNRNAIFSSIIYGYALSIAIKEQEEIIIALGVHSGDHAIYPDCRPEFYSAILEAFSIGNWDSEKVSFYLPYLEKDKKHILKEAIKSTEKLGLDFNVVFRNTNTSYNPDSNGKSSGKSGADVERILAFHSIGREDPVQYVKEWKEILEDALDIEKNYMMGVKK